MATKRPFEALPGLKIPTTGNFTVQASTSSTSPTTGALTVSGDAGIAGSLNLGGRLYVWNSANTFFSAFLSSATANTIYTLPSTSPSTGSSVLQSTSAGVMSWVPMVASGGGAGTVNNGSANHIAYYPSSGAAITGLSTIQISSVGMTISATTQSSSYTTGALVVTGGVGIGGSVYIQGDLTINGTTTTINSTTLTVDDKNIELGSVSVPSDVTAEGGGITLRGASDKTLVWNSGVGWSSSESLNLSPTNTYKINNIAVISSSSIGTGITNSYLTALGIITFGTWSATAITAYYGGTGLQSPFTIGDILYANTPSTWGRISSGSAGSILYSAGSASTPYWGAPGVATINLASTGTTNQAHYIVVSRSATGSGIAISTDSNISVNPSTDTLTVGGLGLSSNLVSTSSTSVSIFNSTTTSVNAFQAGTAISVGAGTGTFSIANSNVRILSSTASSNVNTGSLIVGGGLGVGGQLSFSTASLGYTGVPSTPIMNFIGSGGTSPILLSVYSDSSLSFEGYAGQLFSIDNNLTSGDIFSVSDISGLPIINASAGQTVSINEFGGFARFGNGSISSTGASTSAATGTLVVYGGFGLTGNAFIGGTTTITNATNSTSTLSGSLVVVGGFGLTGNAFIGGTTTISNATNSTSTTSGSLVVSGGFGLTGNAFIGGTATITNASNSSSTTSGSLVVIGGLGLTGNANIGGTVRITNAANSISTQSGSLVVIGGIGITGNAFIGSTTTILATTSSTGTSAGSLVNTGGFGNLGNAFIGGTTTITNATNSTSLTSGALVVFGGAGIAKTLFVGGNTNITGTLYAGTNTFTKILGNGDISLDNGTSDTPSVTFYWGNNKNIGIDTYYAGSGETRFRITKELNESGGAELWSVDRNGIVNRTAYAVGEPISGAMYNYSDLNMAATTTISSTSYTTFATVTYTPKSSSSYIWIEFSATYSVAGTSGDDHWSNIEVNGSEIVNANQIWGNATGGGTRSGVLFPLAARYTNSSTAGIAISVRAKRGSSDDNNTIYGNNASGFMRIQEIGR